MPWSRPPVERQPQIYFNFCYTLFSLENLMTKPTDSNVPRAKTAEEVRLEMLEQMKIVAHYWATLPGKTAEERCDGVVFSILNIFDGSTMALPAMNLVLAPHPDDKEFFQQEGRNWYPDQLMINDCQLHEEYCQLKPVDMPDL